jgi:hypothetical protein
MAADFDVTVEREGQQETQIRWNPPRIRPHDIARSEGREGEVARRRDPAILPLSADERRTPWRWPA